MASKTVLHAKHLEAGAKMVDFHGWEMPINYGSQIEEHHAVQARRWYVRRFSHDHC